MARVKKVKSTKGFEQVDADKFVASTKGLEDFDMVYVTSDANIFYKKMKDAAYNHARKFNLKVFEVKKKAKKVNDGAE